MSLFTEPLPIRYEFEGKTYEMHTDFREWMRFEMLMLDEDILPDERASLLFKLIFPVVPPDPELGSFLIWFYSCGRKPNKVKSRKASKHKNNAAIYSFEFDDGYIYAAFKEVYGIDLMEIEYMHWWQFKALFKGLHGCKFCDIMSCRSEEITDKTPQWKKAHLQECKQLYAIPKSLSEQQKIAEAKRLMLDWKNNTALG